MLLGQPSLDRFSQPPGLCEKYPIEVFQILPDCDVCGRRMEGRFLKEWNDRRVCRPCIKLVMSDDNHT